MMLSLTLIYSLVVAIPLIAKAQTEQTVQTQSEQSVKEQTEPSTPEDMRRDGTRCFVSVNATIIGFLIWHPGYVVVGTAGTMMHCF